MRSFGSRVNQIRGGQGLGAAGTLRVTRRATSSASTFINCIPLTGFAVSGLTTSPVLGMYFTASGFYLYNPAVGLGTVVSYTFTNYTSYNNIFDEYRIRAVNIKGYFSNNESLVTTTTTSIPIFYTAYDFDGSVVATSIGSVLGYQNARSHQMGAMGKPAINRTIKWPRFTSNGVLSLPGQFTDTASSAIGYSALIAYDSQAASQNTTIGTLTFVISMDIEFKGIKG